MLEPVAGAIGVAEKVGGNRYDTCEAVKTVGLELCQLAVAAAALQAARGKICRILPRWFARQIKCYMKRSARDATPCELPTLWTKPSRDGGVGRFPQSVVRERAEKFRARETIRGLVFEAGDGKSGGWTYVIFERRGSGNYGGWIRDGAMPGAAVGGDGVIARDFRRE